jgi:hypothetical protein
MNIKWGKKTYEYRKELLILRKKKKLLRSKVKEKWHHDSLSERSIALKWPDSHL